MIPIAKPFLSDAEAIAARDVVLSGWLMQGSKVDEFEEQFAAYTGASHACAVSSGTAALILALKAVGVRPGDVVLTVSHSFVATANSVRACGAEPVFVDIGKNDYNIDPAALADMLSNKCVTDGDSLWYSDVEGLLTFAETPLHHAAGRKGRVAAILAVHQIGMPCDLKTVCELSSQYNVPVVEDAACAVGSLYEGERLGKPYGDIACFSFHPRKIITTGDGGMITTCNEEYDTNVRLWRQHGLSRSDNGAEKYVTTAFNYRLTDIQAAIGILQLKKLDLIVDRRRELVEIYRRAFKGIESFSIPDERENCQYNWQSLPLEYDGDQVNQTDFLSHLSQCGISARSGIMNAHEELPYLGYWKLPESEMRKRSTILIPLYHDLGEKDIDLIVNSVESYHS